MTDSHTNLKLTLSKLIEPFDAYEKKYTALLSSKVKELRAQGVSKEELLDVLVVLRDQFDEMDTIKGDIITDITDALEGFCHPDARID